jgi:hypothetical protein
MVRIILAGLAIMTVVGLSWEASQAGVVSYVSRAGFSARGIITENYGFEDFFGSYFYYPGDSWTTHGITYTNTRNIIMDPSSIYGNATNVVINDFWTPHTGIINGAYDMFGFDLGSLGLTFSPTLILNTNLNVYNLGVLEIPNVKDGMTFFGFVASGYEEHFTYFRLYGRNGGAPALDNVTLGTVSAVPEPTTFFLLGTGLGGLLFLKRKARS